MSYTVVTDVCEGIADCIPVCPVECMHWAEGQSNAKGCKYVWIDDSICIRCGACLSVCPIEGAILDEWHPELQKGNTTPNKVVLSFDLDLSTVSKDCLALAIRELINKPDVGVQREILRKLRLNSLERLPLDKRKDYVLTMFEAVRIMPGNTYYLQREWWARLPEPVAGLNVEDSAPLRDHLSRQLPIVQLSRIVFASGGSRLHAGSQLAARYPEAVRVVARNAADLDDNPTLDAITRAATAFMQVGSLPRAIDAASSELAAIPVTNRRALPRMLAVLGLAHPAEENSVPELIKYSEVIRYSHRRGNSDTKASSWLAQSIANEMKNPRLIQ
jgi:NAD-dependent dihydropyrimidine dehydrogenase PreA subunit